MSSSSHGNAQRDSVTTSSPGSGSPRPRQQQGCGLAPCWHRGRRKLKGKAAWTRLSRVSRHLQSSVYGSSAAAARAATPTPLLVSLRVRGQKAVRTQGLAFSDLAAKEETALRVLSVRRDWRAVVEGSEKTGLWVPALLCTVHCTVHDTQVASCTPPERPTW